jgi:hypothetical protein
MTAADGEERIVVAGVVDDRFTVTRFVGIDMPARAWLPSVYR